MPVWAGSIFRKPISMQSLRDIRALAYIDRDLIEERATRFARHRASADLKTLMSLVSENAVVTVPGNPSLAPCFGRYSGAAAVLRFYAQCHIEYEVLRLRIVDILVDGERAAVRSSCRMRHRGTGRSCQVEICDILRFENALIIDVYSYMDTLAMSETRECGT